MESLNKLYNEDMAGTPDLNVIYVYSKNVKKDGLEECQRLDKPEHIEKIKNIVKTLLDKSKKDKIMSELSLESNSKKWVTSIIDNYPPVNGDLVEYLLNSFTEAMNTRMKEKDKYAIALVSKNSITLCHSRKGEQTIDPEWNVIQRMLDKDNVIRFVHFENESGDINVKYHEETDSSFFVNWLGIHPRESSFSHSGEYKLHTTIGDDIPLVFELNDVLIEKLLNTNDGLITITKDGNIKLKSSIAYFPISSISYLKKKLKNIDDLKGHFLTKHYDIDFYRNSYLSLPFQSKIDDDLKPIYDCENGLYFDNEIHIEKKLKDFEILFCNKKVVIEGRYLQKLKNKLLNNEPFKIHHTGDPLSGNPVEINGMKIYNTLNCKNFEKVYGLYENMQVRDNLYYVLLFLVLKTLIHENDGRNITYFLNGLADLLIDEIVNEKFVNHENDILEYKASDYFAGTDKEIVDRMVKDIPKKLEISPFCVYIIGADEKTKNFTPLLIHRFGDDRINSLEKNIKSKTRSNVKLVKMPLPDGINCIFLMTVYN